MKNTLSAEEMYSLKQVALGEEKADLVVVNGDMVNVYSGELIKDCSVAVKGEWIAYVGPDDNSVIGPETQVIDASGKVVIPGFIDGHTHMVWYARPEEFIRYVAKGGTTTIITETMELSCFGYSEFLAYLEALEDQPIKIFATIPAGVTLSKSFLNRNPGIEGLKKLLQREDVLGVGEGYWQDVMRNDASFSALAVEALRLGKVVEGHAAGAKEKRLQAYITYGVSSCHESVSAEEVIEKLRLGLSVMIREGSIRKEIKAISEIKDKPLDFRRLSLVTDGIVPGDLIKNGYLECAVQTAIDHGFDPIVAIQMATLNPAEHFHLDGLGGLAPGKYADMVIIPDLRTIRAECVISNGKVIARHGKLLVEPKPTSLSIKGPRDIHVTPSDFIIRAEGEGPFKVRIMDQVTELVTREAFEEMIPEQGELKADPEKDILKAALITTEGKVFTSFIKGLRIKKGVVAISNGWEISGILVVGAKDEQIAEAVNRVAELGGGVVFYFDGQLRVEIPMSIGGLLSDLPIESQAQKIEEIQKQTKELGFPFNDIMLSIATITTPAIPFLRMSEDGLVDFRTAEVVDLVISP